MIENIATSYKVITPPEVEVVSTDDMKNYLKLDGISADDSLIATLLIAARQRCEEYCNIKFIDTAIQQVYDKFPSGTKDALNFSIGNVARVASLKYIDSDGAEQTWDSSNYIVDTYKKAGRVCLASNVSFPSIDSDRINSVSIRYTSGFGVLASDVPDAIKHAIMLQTAYMYNNREDKAKTLATLSEYLLNPFICSFL